MKYKDDLKKTLERRLDFYEETFSFSYDTRFSQIANKSDSYKMAFGGYDELQTLYTSLFLHGYKSKVIQQINKTL